jgi:8-hydroxy-5-deazaflavin:NADPH oxidoreductase
MTEGQASAQPDGPATAAGSDDVRTLAIAVLGGTGNQGRGLARRFAIAGHPVVIGSRSQERAAAAAAEISEMTGGERAPDADAASDAASAVRGLANSEAVGHADVVIVAVPWPGHRDLLASLEEELADKIVVDCVNPIGFDEQGTYPIAVSEGSAVEQAASLLPRSRVVAAFHTLSAVLLLDPEVDEIDQDVLVLGDDRKATDIVQALAAQIPGVRGVYAGRLRNGRQVEGMTANLVSVNRRYKTHAGLRVTDI